MPETSGRALPIDKASAVVHISGEYTHSSCPRRLVDDNLPDTIIVQPGNVPNVLIPGIDGDIHGLMEPGIVGVLTVDPRPPELHVLPNRVQRLENPDRVLAGLDSPAGHRDKLAVRLHVAEGSADVDEHEPALGINLALDIPICPANPTRTVL